MQAGRAAVPGRGRPCGLASGRLTLPHATQGAASAGPGAGPAFTACSARQHHARPPIKETFGGLPRSAARLVLAGLSGLPRRRRCRAAAYWPCRGFPLATKAPGGLAVRGRASGTSASRAAATAGPIRRAPRSSVRVDAVQRLDLPRQAVLQLADQRIARASAGSRRGAVPDQTSTAAPPCAAPRGAPRGEGHRRQRRACAASVFASSPIAKRRARSGFTARQRLPAGQLGVRIGLVHQQRRRVADRLPAPRSRPPRSRIAPTPVDEQMSAGGMIGHDPVDAHGTCWEARRCRPRGPRCDGAHPSSAGGRRRVSQRHV